VPACNKNSAMMAKTTPWLLASHDHNCLKNHTLPGWTAQPTLTTFHRRAVSCNLMPQLTFIQIDRII